MIFWATTIGVLALVTFLIGRTFFERSVEADADAAPDLKVYRDQLSEIDRDVARGTLNAEDAERTRIEVKRRALEADKQAQTMTSAVQAPKTATYVGLGLAVVLFLGVGVGLYTRIGAPGYGDLPLQSRIDASEAFRASRPDQKTVEAQVTPEPAPDLTPRVAELLAELRGVVAERPNDAEGHRLLAAFEPLAGNFQDAYQAKRKHIELLGDAATADDFAELTELLVVAADGYVSPEAEDAINEALKRQPNHGLAIYYYGLLHRQIDRPDVAFGVWQQLEMASHPDAPWLPVLRAELPLTAQLAGTTYTPPTLAAAPALAGPTADDIAAAQDMSEEDRQAMIRGMVDGLADRLANEGGTAPEWARLIAALGTLGETDRAQAIYDESQQVFAGNATALSALNAAASQVGLAQ